MSSDSFESKYLDNTRGKYYVTTDCLDCSLCREHAPNNFARNKEGGYSYVFKQPENEMEVIAVKESIEGCPCLAIFDDGDLYDWDKISNAITNTNRKRRMSDTCSHCRTKKSPWWMIWK
jgi:ferredoxin